MNGRTFSQNPLKRGQSYHHTKFDPNSVSCSSGGGDGGGGDGGRGSDPSYTKSDLHRVSRILVDNDPCLTN